MIKAESTEIVKLLLDKQADIEAKDENKNTLLHHGNSFTE